MMRLLMLMVAVTAVAVGDDLPPSCSRPVYCDSKLLHHVQLADLYPDSKTFVDLQMRNDENTILNAFDVLLNDTNNNPTKEQLTVFVKQYFEENSELEPWIPSDFSDNPKFVNRIKDPDFREFGKAIHGIWPSLAMKVKSMVFEKPEQFSLIPVSHGFIIPGGRFKEIYYWDAFWIIEGLLISGMKDTAKGMIENLIELLNLFGHIPNGSRCYYQERSQPPLLSEMMKIYYKKTNDTEFLKKHIESLEKEMNYWLDSQVIMFNKDGKEVTLLRYYAPSAGPRPESYSEDYKDAQTHSNQTQFYIDIKSAAESGWDFSTRWFISPQGDNSGNLTNIHTVNIIPVDLNSIFAGALGNTAEFLSILKLPQRASHWATLAKKWRADIEHVFWNEEDGIWYDYDLLNMKHRQYFYPSNLAPLWQHAVDESLIIKHTPSILNYLTKSQGLDYPGGVPVSLVRSGEQWDFPNVWPPEVSLVIKAIEAMKTPESLKLAQHLAQEWVRICLKGYKESNQNMFEKYDAEVPGKYGEGGEYTVQAGFGWTNGVVLECLESYGEVITAYDSYEETTTDTSLPATEPSDNGATSLDSLGVVPLIVGGNYVKNAIGYNF